MDFIELAKKRYSVRSYSNKKVEPEKLNRILQAAHVAPTAANLQPVHLIVVQDEDGLAKIGKEQIFTAHRWQSSYEQTTIKHGFGLLIKSRPVILTLPS